VELKFVEKVDPAHKQPILTCLRRTGIKLGHMVNFGEVLNDVSTRIDCHGG
jgi:hypothetical protein